MKIVFCGDLSQNNGPANVNKRLLKYSKFYFWDTKGKKVFKNFFKNLLQFLRSDVVIFSCNYRINYFLFNIAHIIRKKTIYILHGYSGYEAITNRTINSDKEVIRETRLFNKVDLILPVSESYKDWFLEQRPEYKDKTHFITNGIDKLKIIKNSNETVDSRRVIACGANRFSKANKKVAESINDLNVEGFCCNLSIYGYIYPDGELIESNDKVNLCGRIPQKELYEELKKSKLFILNTLRESFGLSVIDALLCGCNILVSKNAGISSILNLEDNDIIYNPNDIDELKSKIKYNLENDNNNRILNAIDFNRYSWEKTSERLEEIAFRLFNNQKYDDIK